MQKSEYSRKYYAENKSKLQEYYRRYYQEHKTTMKKNQKEYYSLHKDEKRDYGKKYYKNHPEKFLESNRRMLQRLGSIHNMSRTNVRRSLQNWSQTVKKNDGHRCCICGSQKDLHAHHIFYKSNIPELMLVPNNGVTLCREHHLEAHGGSWRT